MTLRELFSDESKWTRYYSGRDAEGYSVLPEHPNAACWCLSGAISRCYPVHDEDVRYKVAMYLINERKQTNGAIAPWNDSLTTTFADVRALVERLAI